MYVILYPHELLRGEVNAGAPIYKEFGDAKEGLASAIPASQLGDIPKLYFLQEC